MRAELANRLRRLATDVEYVERVHLVHLDVAVRNLERLVADAQRPPSSGPAEARAELARLRASGRITVVEEP